MKKQFIAFLAIALLLAPLAFSQSRDTGAIGGVVTDDQNAPLPGVNVTISGANLMGVRTFVTDANGEFRFPALPPGEYQIKVELQGFGTVVQEKIRVTTTATLALTIQMKPATVSEEVTVIAQSPTVDVKSTETASVTLSNEILRNIPYNQFTADIVNLAPGVNNNVAFGASQNTGIAYTMDGVNVADPEAGSAWVFSDHNIIEEAKVMGIGLPAEYGNFTGVIFNLVTKSGGNAFSGHFEFNFQGYQADSKFWQAVNNQAYAEDFPCADLAELEAHGHQRPPRRAHRQGQALVLRRRPVLPDQGPPDGLSRGRRLQAAPDLRQADLPADAHPEHERHVPDDQVPGHRTAAPASTVSPEATRHPGLAGLAGRLQPDQDHQPDDLLRPQEQLLRGPLLPRSRGRVRRPTPHFVYDDNMLYDSAGYFYYADRARFGTNASVTHYAEDFLAGSHEFKFGAEFERSMARSRYGFTGTGGELGDNVNYYDYSTATATRGPTWPTSTRATTPTPATPVSRPSSRIPGRSRSGSTSASACATA